MMAPDEATDQPGRYGEVYDRGYKHYEGERLGRRQAFRALTRYSISRSLGIRKRWTAKIVPDHPLHGRGRDRARRDRSRVVPRASDRRER